MTVPFHKYQGAGNDFVVIDNRKLHWPAKGEAGAVRFLCDRRFGIGADGLILLQEKEGYDFEMIYFNADGNESTMCGNGGRCIVAFAHFLGLIGRETRFLAVDGPHSARLTQKDWVELQMIDVHQIETGEDYYFLDTGSPHYVTFVDRLRGMDIVTEARKIRYSDRFRKEGVNVNFVQANGGGIKVATYERGVEDETLSCGTGVTAAAIAWYLRRPEMTEVPIRTRGGELKVRFEPRGRGFVNVWLCGPATRVFKGDISVGSRR